MSTEPQTDVRRIPIRTKLLIGLAIPVFFVALISGVQASKAQSKLNTTKKEVTLALAAGGPTTYITALMDERNITALWLLNLDTAVHLARVKTLEQARVNTDKAQQEFKTSLDRDGKEVQALFGPVFDQSVKSINDLRKLTDADAKTRNPQNAHAKTIYDSYSTLVTAFHTANANAVRAIDDATLHRRADSIAEQTFSSDLLSLMSRSAAITLLQPATAEEKMLAAQRLGQYRISRQRAIADLDDDPVHQKAVEGFYTRESMDRFEKGIEKFAMTGKVDNVPQLINDAANTEKPNGTDAWESVRESLTARGDSLVASASSSRNWYVILFFLATGFSLAFALVIARSISKPLMSIADQADEMASSSLPAAVGEILATPIGQDVEVPHLEPITVRSSDEVADVAVAINAVQTTALDLAVEQAMQRRNFSDTFLNLGQRVQGLINRQLEFITDLEESEDDPEVLANLFKLDHLATRMRRNAESLVVLAGTSQRARTGEAVPVIDSLRSALGEVDEFTRVAIGSVDTVYLPLSVAADLSHLLAELIENGLHFSPASHDVDVIGTRLANGYQITVTDHGSGMTSEQVTTANRRLSGNESFTVAPSRYMGHFVAGHLATGLGIDVSLSSSQAGTTATVLFGDELLVASPSESDSATNVPRSPDQESDAEGGFKPAAPPKAPQSTSLSSLLAVHRKLSQPRSLPEDNSPWSQRNDASSDS